MQNDQSELISNAFSRGISNYFAACRERIPDFCVNHFSYPGALSTNGHAFGWDLLKAPVNLFWAPIYLSLILLGLLFRHFKLSFVAKLLSRTPSGFTTAVQRRVANAIETDILRSESDEDSLRAYIVRELDKLADTIADHEIADHQQLCQQLEPVVVDALKQYTITRTASADITNSLLSTLVGALAFKKFTPGGFAIGIYLASYVAHHMAVNDFLLGAFFGKLYYALFPPTPSWQIMALSIAAILAALAILASFSGIISDPIQQLLGIHRKRLEKLVNHLENDIKQKQSGGFRPKDQYVARILELIDAAKSQLL